MRAHILVLSLFLSLPAGANDIACDGDACDVLPPLKKDELGFYKDMGAHKRWGTLLGGTSGAIIGNEIGGAPGAVGLGALGMLLGYDGASAADRRYWREQAKLQDAAYRRGDDMFYNPAYRLPNNPHYFRMPKKD